MFNRHIADSPNAAVKILPVVLLLMLFGSATCRAQNQPLAAPSIEGTWILVSITATRPDGTQEQPFTRGEGRMMFDANGYYASMLCSLGRANFASNNRLKGTAEEYKATAEGCNNSWGRYKVNPDGRSFTVFIQNATFPNLIGAETTRPFTLSGDELRYTGPGAAGGTAVAIWERAK